MESRRVPPSSPASFPVRAGVFTRQGWRQAAQDPRAVVWALGVGVGGWLPASAVGGALWETHAGFLAGAVVLLTWLGFVGLGVATGVWLVRRGR
jgi:hypothetical protein